MARRDEGQGIGRKGAWQRQNRVVFVVCDGEATEFWYFTDLKQDVRNPSFRVDVTFKRSGGNPRVAVENAILKVAERRDETDVETWVVCDVDDREDLLPDAVRLAQMNGIKLAVSNPCFELWAVLHVKKLGRAEIRRRKMLDDLVREHGLGEPHGRLDYNKLKPNHAAAVSHARFLDDATDPANAHLGNPSTGVWRLTEHICKKT